MCFFSFTITPDRVRSLTISGPFSYFGRRGKFYLKASVGSLYLLEYENT